MRTDGDQEGRKYSEQFFFYTNFASILKKTYFHFPLQQLNE